MMFDNEWMINSGFDTAVLQEDERRYDKVSFIFSPTSPDAIWVIRKCWS